MRTYALVSFSLHAALVACWWWPVARPQQATPQPVEVEVAVRESRGRGTGGGRPRGRGGGNLRRFAVRGDFGLGAHAAHPRPFTEDGDTSGWRNEDFGSGGFGMKYVKHTLRFDVIIREVENLLNYPYPLAKRGIEGTINARLAFDSQGRCDVKRARVSGGSPYLRVYVLALLKKLCALEQTRLPEPMNLDLSFAFQITDEEERRPGQIAGNVLFFTRTFPKGWAEYQLGPIRGVWFAPVVTLDWPWVVEHWEEWVDGKDPLADFR